MLNSLMPTNDNEDPKPRRLKAEEMAQWNSFVDFLDKKKLKGSPELSKGSGELARQLMEEYKKANPSFSLTYDDVRSVQYEMELLAQRTRDFAKRRGSKDADKLMSGVSKIDGFLGEKTSQFKFPDLTERNYHNGQLISQTNQGLINGSFKPTGSSAPAQTINKPLPKGAFKDPSSGILYYPNPSDTTELIRFNPNR